MSEPTDPSLHELTRGNTRPDDEEPDEDEELTHDQLIDRYLHPDAYERAGRDEFGPEISGEHDDRL